MLRNKRANLSILTSSLLVCGALLAGCGKSDESAGKPTGSATAVAVSPSAAPAPATAPATQPAVSTMSIAQLLTVFPAARVRLENEDDQVSVILYSADPPTAINDDYAGNSYYLRMKLDVKDVASVDGAEWRYKSLKSDRSDGHDGIFLNGLRQQLQPSDVVAQFQKTPTGLRVQLAGEFLRFGNTPTDAPGEVTSVTAVLDAAIDAGSKE